MSDMNQTNMPQQPMQGFPQQPYADDEIDLKELFGVLWDGKLIIAAVTGIAAIIAVIVAISMTNIYRSEALLMPTSGGDAGGLAAKFGGLASLAGVSLGGGGAGDKTALGIEVIKSRQFLQTFIDKRDVLVPLMAAEGWNKGSDTLKINDDLYDVETKQWVREVDPPKSPEPSLQEAHEV
ncbi:MAG TPA: Wzz/FepE/Etk N-terminal domain-containing protein, partial [Pseudomonadales bacterium]|nr:Wzz/FepE/Etk N-terminal domain-containing protein [Pseudomonadales bacterium]